MATELVDVDAVALPAFGLRTALAPGLQGDWHRHARHQLLYAARGTLQLEVIGSQWVLPPQRAAWIPGDTRHRVFARDAVDLTTVYLNDAVVLDGPSSTRVFVASPLLREMVATAARLGTTGASDEAGRRLLDTIGAWIPRWAAEPLALRLPTGQSEELRRAMDWTREHMAAEPSVGGAAREAGLSERSLARRFAAEAGMTWSRYLRTARILQAMALLERPGARVTEAAYEVGFDSLGAFARAFRELTGELPSDYRQRVASSAATSP